MLDRDRLLRYAAKYRKRHDADPTFRQASKALRMTLDEVEQAAEDAKDWGLPVDITVAFGIPGVGAGACMPRHEWQIETWDA
jgi:hypothetical protein